MSPCLFASSAFIDGAVERVMGVSTIGELTDDVAGLVWTPFVCMTGFEGKAGRAGEFVAIDGVVPDPSTLSAMRIIGRGRAIIQTPSELVESVLFREVEESLRPTESSTEKGGGVVVILSEDREGGVK